MRLRENIIREGAIHQEANHAFLRMFAGRSDSGAKPDAWAECRIQAHKGLPSVDKHAFPLWQSQCEIFQGLRGARNKGLREMEKILWISGRHGQPANRTYARKEKQQWQLRTEKLQMGNMERASGQSSVSAFVLSALPTANHAPIAENLFAWSAGNTMPTANASALEMPRTTDGHSLNGVECSTVNATRPNEKLSV